MSGALTLMAGAGVCIAGQASALISLAGATGKQIVAWGLLVYTDGDFIICVTDERTDSRLIHDVKKVTDHGEYYELCFNYGKYSDMFICQKNLLTRGTLQGFEKMFQCKIIRINSAK